MYKLTHLPFTVFVCDGRGVRGDLVDGILQMGTGELNVLPTFWVQGPALGLSMLICECLHLLS